MNADQLLERLRADAIRERGWLVKRIRDLEETWGLDTILAGNREERRKVSYNVTTIAVTSPPSVTTEPSL